MSDPSFLLLQQAAMLNESNMSQSDLFSAAMHGQQSNYMAAYYPYLAMAAAVAAQAAQSNQQAMPMGLLNKNEKVVSEVSVEPALKRMKSGGEAAPSERESVYKCRYCKKFRCSSKRELKQHLKDNHVDSGAPPIVNSTACLMPLSESECLKGGGVDLNNNRENIENLNEVKVNEDYDETDCEGAKLKIDEEAVVEVDENLYECAHCDILFRDYEMYRAHCGYHVSLENRTGEMDAKSDMVSARIVKRAKRKLLRGSDDNNVLLKSEMYKCGQCGTRLSNKLEFFMHIGQQAHS